MRILHVAPSVARAYGGPTYSLAGYSAAATSRDAEVVIAAPRPTEADDMKILIFREGDPRVEVREDAEHGTYQIIKKPVTLDWARIQVIPR